MVEVGIDLPAGLEDDLVDVLEEGGRLRLCLVLKPVLAPAVDAGLVHGGVLVVLLTIGLLPYLCKDQDVVAEGVGKIGVEEDVLAICAVHNLVCLPLGCFLAELTEDVLKVGLENRVLAGALLAGKVPGLRNCARRDALEEGFEGFLRGKVDVTHVGLPRKVDLHADAPPGSPGHPVVGVPFPVPGEQTDNVFAGDGLQASVDDLVCRMLLIDRRTVEVVAAV